MDSLYGNLPGAVPPLAGNCGSVRHLDQPSAPGLLLTNGGPPGCRDRCDAPVLGSSPGLRLPAIWVHPEILHQGSPVPQPRGNCSGSFLAAPSVVPGSMGAPGGGAGPPTSVQGSAPSAALSPFPSEPPSARSDLTWGNSNVIVIDYYVVSKSNR